MFYNKWVNPKKEYAFSGISKIYNHFQGAKSINEIKNDLAEIRTYTLHREKKKIKNYNPFFIYKKHQLLMADLCYLPQTDKETNRESKYLLCVIDCFSRKLFIRVIAKKNFQSVLNSFKSIYTKLDNPPPTSLLVDKGTEFTNKHFKQYCQSVGMKLIFTGNDTKASHVERSQRSLQEILYKIMEEKQTNSFLPLLDSALSIYNNRVNRITGFSPNDAYKDENHESVLGNLEIYYSKALSKRRPPTYKVGDSVRLALKKTKFDRGYKPRFTEEVFKIKQVLTNLPQPRYILESYNSDETIDGSFYEGEITKASHEEFKIEKILKERKRGRIKEYFVKWQGYPESQNSWVSQNLIRKF